MTLRTKLLATYIGVTVTGVVLFSLFSSWQIKSFLDRRTESALSANVEAIGEHGEAAQLSRIHDAGLFAGALPAVLVRSGVAAWSRVE